MTWPSLSLRYSYTDSVGGSLSFQNGKAFCSGFISPLDDSFVKITVTLYKKSGNQWLFVKSWSGNSSGGMTASAGGSVAVDHGTYKLVTTGNVGNLEYPSYSTQKTY